MTPFQHVASPTRADGTDKPCSSAVVLSKSMSQTRLDVQANDEEQPVAAFEITEHGSKLAVTSQWLQHIQVWMLSPCTPNQFHIRSHVIICPCLRAVLSWRANVHTWLR